MRKEHEEPPTRNDAGGRLCLRGFAGRWHAWHHGAMESFSSEPASLVVVVMGVSGSGKSTVGRLLAERLGCRFVDADDLHPPANVARMAAGQPLTDADRAPWLDALRTLVAEALQEGAQLVLACSALRASYRERLRVDPARVHFVHLAGDATLIAARQADRRDHFMPASLLASQFATLEPPDDAITVDIIAKPESVVDTIVAALNKGRFPDS